MDLLGILPDMGNLLFTLIAFVVALSVIVFVHEFGHYIVGRWTGIAAEVFSVGFGPVIWSREDRRGTRWQIALYPFGGYVRFKGDDNAASVTAADRDAPRDTMVGAPLWARTLTVLAGPMFNFIFTVLIFTAALMLRGQVTEPLRITAVDPLPPAYGQELQPGDELLAIEGAEVPPLEELSVFFDTLPVAYTLSYTVRRDGTEMVVDGPYPIPPRAEGITPRSAADDAGLRPGDVILAVDGQDVIAFEDVVRLITGGGGREVRLTVWRDGEVFEVGLTPRLTDEPSADGGFEKNWRIGIAGDMALQFETERVGLGLALLAAVDQLWFIISSSLSGLWNIITGAISTCNLSGPVGIAEVSGSMAAQGADDFIRFIAVLSTAVGLLNLFPIPVLDGGHLVFYAYEAVTGRTPGERALRVLMAIGLTLILGLMLFAIANDLFLCP